MIFIRLVAFVRLVVVVRLVVIARRRSCVDELMLGDESGDDRWQVLQEARLALNALRQGLRGMSS